MASDKGFFNKDKEVDRSVDLLQDHITASPMGEKKIAKDVNVQQFAYEAATNSIVSATASTLEITAHGAKVGDKIEFTSGALTGKEVQIIKVIDVDNLEIGELLSTLPSAADTVRILRHRSPVVNADGSLPISSGPIQFIKDGSTETVTEDTGTPANNLPLPVKLTSVTGDINITAGDLNVQTSHIGASADSIRIGDGTEELSITASGEAETSDSTAHTKLDSLLTELQLKADLSETQPVSAVSLPLPSGAATEAKQDSAITELQSIEAKDFATQTTIAALLVELQLKADLTETQPVSMASIPLASGAATEAKQDDAITQLTSIAGEDFATQTTLAALLTELQAKADLAETQPVSLASQPLPTGAATEATLASLAAEDFASETTLAALSAKVTACDTTGKATESKQDSIITELQSILAEQALDVVEFARHDYSSPVTTAAYTELVASTSSDIKELQIFDSSGQTLVIAIGAAASEVDKLYIFPGGNGNIKAIIPSGSRISIKAVSATADAGELSVNFLG